jgi:hypothetical protein
LVLPLNYAAFSIEKAAAFFLNSNKKKAAAFSTKCQGFFAGGAKQFVLDRRVAPRNDGGWGRFVVCMSSFSPRSSSRPIRKAKNPPNGGFWWIRFLWKQLRDLSN